MGLNSLPKTVTRQRRDCDLNPGPSAPESSTLTTQLPSHPVVKRLYSFSDMASYESVQQIDYVFIITHVPVTLIAYRYLNTNIARLRWVLLMLQH